MKLSKYNVIKKRKKGENQWIAYNSLQNTLAILDEQNYLQYKKLVDNEGEVIDEELENNLINGGFLINDDYDEDRILEYNKNKRRFGNKKLCITIAPTFDCNFRCVYCYEKDRYKYHTMSDEVAAALIEMVKEKAGNISKLAVTWYGGEPLLAMGMVEKLSKEFISICEENNIDYYAAAVTNGYLLTENTARKLKELRVNVVQITLDGPEEIHNKKRPLVNGGETFGRIIENLKEAAVFFDEINIRVNCDKDNMSYYADLYNDIKSIGLNNIKMYPAPIRDFDGCFNGGSCYVRESFKDAEYEIYKSLGKEIFNRYIVDKYPATNWNYCSAVTENCMIVAPNGDLYRCWVDLGKQDKAFGNILDRDDIKMNNYLQYYSNPTKEKECGQCSLYPICLGGCPYENSINSSDNCEYTEDMLFKYLDDIIEVKMNEADMAEA